MVRGTRRKMFTVFGAMVIALIVCSNGTSSAQNSNETPYAASRLVWRWRVVMNQALEDSRAFAAEEVADRMEEFVSPGAVRAIQDKLKEDQLHKADDVLREFVRAMVKVSMKQPDGSSIVDESAVDAAAEAICPVYPFCGR